MNSDAPRRTISSIYDAAVLPDLWPAALQSVMDEVGAAGVAALQGLLEPLARAARLHVELGSLGWKSSIALTVLDQLAAAVIVTDGNGRVIEINRAAERILQREDGLTVRNGKVAALHI